MYSERLDLVIDKKLKRWLKKEAKRRYISVAELIRQLIRAEKDRCEIFN